ncbi:aminotransferase DegT [Micromonospora rosaria]|uniref:Aminotransferase DegT n=1 Tax=Micromonospora rosaria TaxID=47874 RepID=A0A136PZK4_9ACTN|nr:DegT/DnrJ/EryC1/StrS family aminotransferase [Micromonospora rosaria]KXK63885.1 aminotransferase DegT [Micromonospora rosaria]
MTASRRHHVPYPTLGTIVGDEEVAVVTEVLLSGKRLSQGSWRSRFEEAFRDHVGSRYAFSVTSGTVALRLAIQLLDLREGDEVVVTPQTYQATAQPLLDHRATVRFCDIDPNTLNIDVSRLADLVSPRTRAVILVHYGGLPAEMAAVRELADRYDFVIVEDCAHALGAEYFGEQPGVLGDIACFSFHSTKNITTLGEGGMLTLNRDDWAERIGRLRNNECDAVFRPAPSTLRKVPRAMFDGLAHSRECVAVRTAGTNATLSEPAAAVGLVQLGRLPALTEARRRVAADIDAALAHHPAVRLQVAPEGHKHSYHLYTLFVRPERGVVRDRVVERLVQLGVDVWLRYFPLHLLPEWRSRGHRLGDCPVAERCWFEEQINLPCHPAFSEVDVKSMVAALGEALDHGTRA